MAMTDDEWATQTAKEEGGAMVNAGKLSLSMKRYDIICIPSNVIEIPQGDWIKAGDVERVLRDYAKLTQGLPGYLDGYAYFCRYWKTDQ